MGTLQLACLAMMAVFTSTLIGGIRGGRHGTKITKWEGRTRFFPFPLRERICQKCELPQPPSTMHVHLLLLLFQGAVSTLMNSKMLRFAFQFGNLPLKGDKVPRL